MIANLALERDVGAHHQVLGHLLGDGRAALRPPGRPRSPRNARIMPCSSTPWCLKKRLSSAATKAFCTGSGMSASGTQMRRCAGLPSSAKGALPEIEHPRHAGQRLAVEPGRVGQIGGRLVVERDHGAEIDGRGRHRFVLAELPIGREQVVPSGRPVPWQ